MCVCVSVCALAFSTFFAPIALLPSLCSSAFYSTEISEKTSEIHKTIRNYVRNTSVRNSISSIIPKEIYVCACVCVCALAFAAFLAFAALFWPFLLVRLLMGGFHVRSSGASRRFKSSAFRIDEPKLAVLRTTGTCVQRCVSVCVCVCVCSLGSQD